MEIDLKQRSAYATWTQVSIRYRDLDPNGHVNNGAVNQYFEDGRVHFRDERMVSLGDDILTGFAVARFEADYHAALRYPGIVDVGTVVTRIGNTSYGLGQGVFLDETCIATARVVSVFFDPSTGKPRPLPDDLRAVLEAGMVGGC